MDFIKRLKNSIRWRSQRAFDKVNALGVKINLEFRWALKRLGLLKQVKHDLPNKLVISFTSYKPRLPYVHNTIKSILCQNMDFDNFVLWIDEDDFANLSENIKYFEKFGLEIKVYKNIGPYTKIIPSLISYNDHFIITIDDDIIYPSALVSDLVKYYSGKNTIICKRAHVIKFDDNKNPIKYMNWEIDARGPIHSKYILPTGVGGVLYPPNIFDKRVLDEDAFMMLAPRADDLWLYWMARMSGADYYLVPQNIKLSYVDNTQEVGLLHENLAGGNDKKFANLMKEYGFPH